MIAPQGGACSPSIIEVGCGTGLFTARLAELLPGATITATDAFPAMIEEAKPRLARFTNVRLAQYDAEEELSADQRFDAVCGCDIIHHIDEPVKAMRNWLNVMKPGGQLAFFESNGINPVLLLRTYGKAEEARLTFSRPHNLRRWLAEAGWREIDIDYAAIHLPNGPTAAWHLINRIEELMHKVPPLRAIAGGLLIKARSPG
jgi:2-polyprenyl-3-methyl-5-hydroxy-6-metoxy-1,4-benzoquinol methylase